MTEKNIDNIIAVNFTGNNLLKNKKLFYPLLFIFTLFAITFILSWKYFPRHFYQAGIVAPRDITASKTFEVENEVATREAQSKAMNSVKPVYVIDEFINSEVDSALQTQFAIFHQLKELKKNDKKARIQELKSQLPISISSNAIQGFLDTDEKQLKQLEVLTRNLVNLSLQEKIKPEDNETLKNIRNSVAEKALTLTLPEVQKKAVAELASSSIKANAKVDWNETSRVMQERKDSVKPVTITIKKGQVIVGKGQIITPEHIRIIEKMGLQNSSINFTAVAGIALFVLLSITIIWFYIKLSFKKLADSPQNLLLLSIITIVNVLLISLLIQIHPCWAPVPIASMLIAILLNPYLSVIITSILSITVGILTGDVQFAGISLITGIASVIAVWNVNRRLDLISASVKIFLVNALSVFVFMLLSGEPFGALLESLIYGGSNGFTSGIITIGILPLLEYSFGITTHMKLLELSNQSEPLLKRLLVEAPGTYHHSIIVGNLAEAGAELVGEDPLLCRVASYYHDIGKLKRPYFFIENQLGSENPHDKLSSRLSALVIIGHAKDGLELGKQHNLPEPILDIIGQHHGTSLVSFFYNKAMEEGIEPLEADFRYPGPKPQSKAAAIVMLADSAEAAARTLKNPNPEKIEKLVKSIFRRATDEGQLDESPLSLKNINDLIESFTKNLTSIYHHRIEYPEKILEQASVKEKVSKIKINQNKSSA